MPWPEGTEVIVTATAEIERPIDPSALQRRMQARFAPHVHALGFSRWKQPIVRACFGGSLVTFVRRAAQLPPGATVAVWGPREVPAAARAAQVVRLEDGFLRSVGLGADLVQPLSLTMDRMGLHYDPSRPSELERLCATASFDAALTERARALRERIVAQGYTKYNLSGRGWSRPPRCPKVVLVAGQVEGDASLALGGVDVRSNLELLRATRRRAPDAYIVYKPHPDVVARLRRAGERESEAARLCDEIVDDVPMHVLLRHVDEVHVMTSLTGFEALLRGKRVVVLGQPFYAGWGLTVDRHPIARRERILSLDELVAATLILYPTYVSRTTGRFTTPEGVLDELGQWRAREASHRSLWHGAWRGLLRGALRVRSAVL